MTGFDPVDSSVYTPWQSNHASLAGKASSMFRLQQPKEGKKVARENIKDNCPGTVQVVNVVFMDLFM